MEPFTVGVLPALLFFEATEAKESMSKADLAESSKRIAAFRAWTTPTMKKDLHTLGANAEALP